MKTVKIEYRFDLVNEFPVEQVDHIKTVKMFDVWSVNRDEPTVQVHTDYALDTPKSGRLIEVVTFDSKGVCHLHYYNADAVTIKFA